MNKPAERIKELEEQTADPEEHEEVLKAIERFCFDCPLHDGAGCILCYLHKWRDGYED